MPHSCLTQLYNIVIRKWVENFRIAFLYFCRLFHVYNIKTFINAIQYVLSGLCNHSDWLKWDDIFMTLIVQLLFHNTGKWYKCGTCFMWYHNMMHKLTTEQICDLPPLCRGMQAQTKWILGWWFHYLSSVPFVCVTITLEPPYRIYSFFNIFSPPFNFN